MPSRHRTEAETKIEQTDATLEQEIANAVAELAITMIKSQLGQDVRTSNLLISPISLFASLASLYSGSVENTRHQIAKVMGLSSSTSNHSDQEIYETLGEILQNIRTTAETFIDLGEEQVPVQNVINPMNRIFLQSRYSLIPSYESQVQTYCNSEIIEVDFRIEPTKATDIINECISNHTNHRIPKILHDTLDYDSRIILASCLYFKATWSMKFPANLTKEENFDTGSGKAVVKMMRYRLPKQLPYITLPHLNLEAVALPYKGQDMSMFIILPKPDYLLDDLISSLDAAILRQIAEQAQPTALVKLKLPHMKLNYSEDVISLLRKSGIKDAFDGNARFDNMIERLPLYVSKIIHAVEIQVDEKGTEGVAASAKVKVVDFMAKFPADEPIQFYVDRAFLFFIYHRITKVIICLSVVRDPSAVH